MAGRRLREHFAAVLCYASEERKKEGGVGGDGTKPSLSELPSSCSSYDEIPASASLAVDPKLARRGWALLFVYSLQNRAHHKIIGRIGRA